MWPGSPRQEVTLCSLALGSRQEVTLCGVALGSRQEVTLCDVAREPKAGGDPV